MQCQSCLSDGESTMQSHSKAVGLCSSVLQTVTRIRQAWVQRPALVALAKRLSAQNRACVPRQGYLQSTPWFHRNAKRWTSRQSCRSRTWRISMLNFKRIASSTALGLSFALFAASASHAAPTDNGFATFNLNTAKNSQQSPLINVAPKEPGAGGTPRRKCVRVPLQNCAAFHTSAQRDECERRNQQIVAEEQNCPGF
jgi:hypothetical protein